jgi:hypothetical protein
MTIALLGARRPAMDETQIDWLLTRSQPGWVIRMQAKPGKGDDPFETVTRLFKLMAAPALGGVQGR